jgi:cell division protein FtsX
MPFELFVALWIIALGVVAAWGADAETIKRFNKEG